MARREPGEPAYRRALVTTYRAAGHIDQSARWGAADPASLDDRERRILRRRAASSASEEALRAYLVLPGVLPAEVAEALPSRARRRRGRSESAAQGLVQAAAITATLLVGPAVAIGIGITLVQAFLGHGAAFGAAQMTAVIVLLGVAWFGVLGLLVSVLRGRWIRAVLMLVPVVVAVVVLGHADMTTTTPFG